MSGSFDHLLRTPTRLALAALIVALAAMLPTWGWRLGRLAVTALHEAGHAVAVLSVGGRVRAVHLRADTSGLTWHEGVSGRGARMFVAGAGYPAPGLAALAGAALVRAGHPEWWLGALATFAAVEMVLWVRNFFGLLITLLATAGLCACLALASPTGCSLAAAATAWFLALGGLRASAESRRDRGVSDASELARVSRLPAGCYRVGFVLLSLLAAAGSAVLLFRLPT